ncbi:MAG TPA: sigma-70 family RNA polymerase sigma factor [Solirubrobacteraceae bacterium]|nr:sigma-70 family RNA polymerase sigma factor [Solirubrobacteraceae bacterium]
MTNTSSHPPAGAESALLKAAQSGDQRAFGGLVEPYRRALTVHSYRMLGSPHDAEDVVQETLLRAWRNLGSYEPRAPLSSWLYRIATNASLDEIERRPRRPQPVEPYPDKQLADADAPTYDPAARYALREGLELSLLRAIQQLPGRQRAVLILRDVLGWTSPEVAELLETSVAAINSALQRARATIDESLPATGPSPAAGDERELLQRYVQAFANDDVDGLVAILREDAVLRMPPQPDVFGADAIAAFLRSVAPDGTYANFHQTPRWANGRPAVTTSMRSASGELIPHAVSLLIVEGGQIVGIETFLDQALATRFEDGVE